MNMGDYRRRPSLIVPLLLKSRNALKRNVGARPYESYLEARIAWNPKVAVILRVISLGLNNICGKLMVP